MTNPTLDELVSRVSARGEVHHDYPTLQEIARETYWDPELRELLPKTISAALREAGLDPNNESERLRFQTLVAAENALRTQDEIARLGDYADAAMDELGEDASDDDIVARAQEIREEEEEEENVGP